jgi:hypothetical protein
MPVTVDFSEFGDDHTDAIQQTLNSAGGNQVIVPPGDWLIDAVRGIQLPGRCNLVINGNLHAIPNDSDWSHILLADGVGNVQITVNGQIVGERMDHQSTNGTGHGMGVMLNNASNVLLNGSGIITQCWGDGIYIWGCTGVVINGINSLGNRRNNMSVISVNGLNVSSAAFNDANGAAPEAGIDLEPDDNTQYIKNVDIGNCQFVNNAGCGVQFGFGGAPQSNFSNVKVHDNVYKGNKPIGGVNTPLANLLYATCRWLPGYDWWGFPTSYTIP